MSDPKTPPVSLISVSVRGFKGVVEMDVAMNPTGLTVLEGQNMAGKTSFAEAVLHGLLGPTWADRVQLINDDAEVIKGSYGARAVERFDCDNGMVIERRLTDKNDRTGLLTVKMPDGSDGNQDTLTAFWSAVALKPADLGQKSERERLKFLLGGLRIDLTAEEAEYAKATAAKESAYAMKERARKHAEDLPVHEGVPPATISAADVAFQLQQAHAKNAANDRVAEDAKRATRDLEEKDDARVAAERDLLRLRNELEQAEAKHACAVKAVIAAREVVDAAQAKVHRLSYEDTRALEARLANIEAINAKVRENETKAAKMREYEELLGEWRGCDRAQAEALRAMGAKIASADVPMPEIGVDCENMRVLFNGRPWGQMSGAQRRIFETAVQSLYNPNARLVIVDGMESHDAESEACFHEWLVSRGLQSLATRVANAPTGQRQDGILRFWISEGRAVRQ